MQLRYIASENQVWSYVIQLGIGRILRTLSLVVFWPLETIRRYLAVRLNLKFTLLFVSFVAKYKSKIAQYYGKSDQVVLILMRTRIIRWSLTGDKPVGNTQRWPRSLAETVV